MPEPADAAAPGARTPEPASHDPHPLASIDPVLHAPARLLIATHLYVVAAADAVFLQSMTGLTWGNLSAHLQKLEEAGYVTIEKSFRGRKPRTVIALTESGRTALRAYRTAMLQSLGPLNA